MKKISLLSFIPIIIFSLASCSFPSSNGGGGGGVTPDPEESEDYIDITDVTSTYVDPNTNPDIKPSSGTTTINIVALNDFHGAVENHNGRMGLLKVGSYLANKSKEANTLILDQGDTWQGSIYSNYNHGKLINDVYAYAHVHARTVGNHDFDWGITKVIENTEKEFLGYKVPVLAANVYDYDYTSKVVGEVQQSEIGGTSISYTLKNGLKVGIVGVIGQDQIASITSSYVQDIAFINHINVIKSEATYLRNNEGCDIVIASCHTGQDDVLKQSLSDYVDLVLCGHTHQYESTYEGDTLFAQFAAYGEKIGDISLVYDYGQKKVTSSTISIVDDYTPISIDSNVRKIVEQYNSRCDARAKEVIAANTSYFAKSEHAVNLMCKAIFDETKREKFDVVLAMCNTARNYLKYGSWKYSDIFEAFTFDNVVYIVEVSGRDIRNEASYNNICMNPKFNREISLSKKYRIAVIDYVLYHTNTEREFDYFPSFTGEVVGALTNNYRIILKNWLIRNKYNVASNYLNSNNYSNDVDEFNRNSIYYTR